MMFSMTTLMVMMLMLVHIYLPSSSFITLHAYRASCSLTRSRRLKDYHAESVTNKARQGIDPVSTTVCSQSAVKRANHSRRIRVTGLQITACPRDVLVLIQTRFSVVVLMLSDCDLASLSVVFTEWCWVSIMTKFIRSVCIYMLLRNVGSSFSLHSRMFRLVSFSLWRYVRFSLCLFLSVSVCLFVCLSLFHSHHLCLSVTVCLSASVSLHPFFLSLFVFLSLCLRMSICPSLSPPSRPVLVFPLYAVYLNTDCRKGCELGHGILEQYLHARWLGIEADTDAVFVYPCTYAYLQTAPSYIYNYWYLLAAPIYIYWLHLFISPGCTYLYLLAASIYIYWLHLFISIGCAWCASSGFKTNYLPVIYIWLLVLFRCSRTARSQYSTKLR